MKNYVQVLLYTSYLHVIGGIETFVLNWIELMSPYYDIGILCPKVSDNMAVKIIGKVPLYSEPSGITCDTLVMVRAMDSIPEVKYKHSVRMCHSLKSDTSSFIRYDCERIVHVSEASKESYASKGEVIYNPLLKSAKKSLLLVSATRIPAPDKGKNAERMIQLAEKLNMYGIPFVWLNFSDMPLNNAPKGFVNVGTFQDLQPFIKKADYLVQLSDREGFGYSVLEALINNIPVIVTPFKTTEELGVKDGVNGYVVPFNLEFDPRILLEVPKFEYSYDNESIEAKWREIFGESTPSHEYIPPKTKKVKVLRDYFDVVLKRNLKQNDVVEMEIARAYKLKADNRHLVKLMEG